jgi:hypothetical protein
MTEPETPEPAAKEAPAAHVIEALTRVMRDMPGIGKDLESAQGYKYRGIEQISAVAQKLLARHCVVAVPKVLSRKVVDVTINNKPWTQDELEVIYHFYGPGGLTDVLEVGPVWGLGRDNSDKGANKAFTQAMKVTLIQVLCIGDSTHDADADKAHEADARGRASGWFGWDSRDDADAAHAALAERIKEAGDAVRDRVKQWRVEHAPVDADGAKTAEQAPWPMSYDSFQTLTEFVLPILAQEATTAAPGAQDSPPEPVEAPSAAPGAPAPPESANGATAEAVEATAKATESAIEFVKGLDAKALTVELDGRQLDTTGTDADRRRRLTIALLKETARKAWQPEEVEATADPT